MEIGTQVKVKQGNYFDYLNEFKLVVHDYETASVQFPIVVRIGDTDSFEWFTQDELQTV